MKEEKNHYLLGVDDRQITEKSLDEERERMTPAFNNRTSYNSNIGGRL